MSTASSSRSRSSSPRCVPFAFRRGAGERRLLRGLPPPATPPPPPAGAHPAATTGCGRPLCRAAEAVGGGVRGAFFASLDRCSCVEVGTTSFKEPEMMPLMTTPADGAAVAGASRRVPSSSSASVVIGNTQAGGGGSSRRRGIGCCSANSTSVN